MATRSAVPAAAGRCLDQHRVAKFLRQLQGLAFAFDQPFAARHGGHIGLAGHGAGRILVAQLGHGLRRGADKGDVAIAADLGEMGVLGQKAVARMYRFRIADLGRADDLRNPEIAVRGLGRTDAVGLVGHLQIGGAAVGLAEDGHRLDAHFPAGAKYPQGNLASIGNEYAIEHQPRVSTLNRGWLNSTGCPLSTKTAWILPDTSACTWLNDFMASTMQMTVSGPTWSPTFTNGGDSGLGEE